MSRSWKLMWLLNRVDPDFSMKTFNDRKKFQKIVVLAQELDIPLGYGFGWYKHGPYSSSLADDGFTIDQVPRDSWSEFINLADMKEFESRADSLEKLIERAVSEIQGLDETQILELLASLVFLARHAYPRLQKKEDAIEALKAYKSFTPTQMELAWEILKDARLV
ncbi:MAG: hypothetical protein DRP08_07895 [Candidatus Aenigmatarchaeota archaeon]|nr:MAG: hypothetical protein DRP08_07895 [Candidatus Aenigmarchaeota archaeon]